MIITYILIINILYQKLMGNGDIDGEIQTLFNFLQIINQKLNPSQLCLINFCKVVDSGFFNRRFKLLSLIKKYLYNVLWKHGQAGVIDNQGKIKPTNWYDKQEKFELEVVVANNAQIQKIYNNLLLISNKAKPEEFSFEIVGESYDWFNL